MGSFYTLLEFDGDSGWNGVGGECRVAAKYLPPWSLARLCLPACSIMSFKTITSAKKYWCINAQWIDFIHMHIVCRTTHNNTFHIHHCLPMDGFDKRIVVTMFYFTSLVSVFRSMILFSVVEFWNGNGNLLVEYWNSFKFLEF